MAGKSKLKINPSRMLISAARRLELPALPVRISYDPEIDILTFNFRDDLEADRSTDDLDLGLVYDYQGRTLVRIEVLNAALFADDEDE